MRKSSSYSSSSSFTHTLVQEARQQLQGEMELRHKLEADNQSLAVSLKQEKEKCDNLAAAESNAHALVRNMQEHTRMRENQMTVLKNSIDREKEEVQVRESQVRGMQEKQDELTAQIQDLLDEITQWKHTATEREFELQEVTRKLAHLQDRHQDLSVRYERVEATLQSTRIGFEESKFSLQKNISGKDDLHKQELSLLHAQLRAAEHALQESRDTFNAALSARSQEARKESQMRKEAEARDAASKTLAREQERKVAILEDQLETIRRHQEDSAQILNENAHRFEHPLGTLVGSLLSSQSLVRSLTRIQELQCNLMRSLVGRSLASGCNESQEEYRINLFFLCPVEHGPWSESSARPDCTSRSTGHVSKNLLGRTGVSSQADFVSLRQMSGRA